MKKTIGVFAHVDAGKTTFSEQILYHTNSIRTRGRVDHKDAYLDNNKIEKERGITVFSEIGKFDYCGNEYYLIDTPGHVDFSAEMERSISVLDYAVIIVSAVEGVQGHTETVWSLLRKFNIPCFFFINKIDREGADVEAVVSEIKHNLTEDFLILKSDFDEETIEFIAEHDEELLEKYLDGDYDENQWKQKLKILVKEGRVSLASCGSALLDEGISEFLKMLDDYTYTEYNSDSPEFKARAFKVKYDEKNNRIIYLKILEGNIKVKDNINCIKDGEIVSEKINEIRVYNGEKYKAAESAVAGEIVGITGIDALKSGSGINIDALEDYQMVPTLRAKVIFDEKLNPRDVLKVFKILENEDRSLNVTWSEEFQEINISIMGIIQLEVLKESVLDRFSIDIEFGEPEILYKETIDNAVDAFGHFEPLRHYAEVYLRLEKSERGSGITFENKCHPDDLSVGHQNLIRTHVFEREHKGILTGSPITDMKITLVTGRAHLKHTEGGDFREAVKRAIRQGLEQADNVLLEPYYNFKMDVNIDLMGRVLSDIQKMDGTFKDPVTYRDRVIVEGRGPVSSFMNYPLEFQAFTKGKGALSFTFSGYDRCNNTEEVIEARGYNKNADPEYTSSSVFCAKGAGYSVPWDEVKACMHCLKR